MSIEETPDCTHMLRCSIAWFTPPRHLDCMHAMKQAEAGFPRHHNFLAEREENNKLRVQGHVVEDLGALPMIYSDLLPLSCNSVVLRNIPRRYTLSTYLQYLAYC